MIIVILAERYEEKNGMIVGNRFGKYGAEGIAGRKDSAAETF